MKLECMRRRQHALFGIARRLIMVVRFAVGFCHFSPHSLASASFLMRRSTFRGISPGTRVPHCIYYGQYVLFWIAGRLIMVVSFAVGFCHFSPHSLASASFLMRRFTFRGICLRIRVPHCNYYNFDLTV